jgi:hypothetical protein
VRGKRRQRRVSKSGRPQAAPAERTGVWASLGPRSAAALFAAALVLRLWYVFSIWGTRCFLHPMTEGRRYLAWAAALRDGAGLDLPFDEAPGYALALAALGGGAERVAVLQAVLGSATVVGLAFIAAYVSRDRVIGWLTGALAAAYGPFLLAAGEVVPSTLFLGALVFATLATLAAACPHPRRPRLWWGIASVAWALTLVVRSEAVVALPFVALYARRARGRRALAAVLLAPLLTMGAMAAVTGVKTGHAVPLTIGGGLNLWLGNHAESDGINPFPSPSQDAELEAMRASVGSDVGEEDWRLGLAAVGSMRQRPLAAAALLAKKTLLVLSPVELPNTNDVAWQARQSSLFLAWPVFPFDFALVLALALFSRPRLSSLRAFGPLGAGVATIGLVTCALFLSNGRFRLPVVLPLLVLAACGARRLLDRESWRRPGQALRLGASLLGVLVLLHLDLFGLRRYVIPELEANAALCDRAEP